MDMLMQLWRPEFEMVETENARPRGIPKRSCREVAEKD